MDKKVPECFGDIDTVFPKGKNGLRHSPETCIACFHKTECLKSAIRGSDGLAVRKEFVDRAYTSGAMSFLERWSQKKALHCKRKEKPKDRRERNRS
jgi:hypothetical protein